MPPKLIIDDIIKLAKERGGELISKEYINTITPMLFKCANNHEFYAKVKYIKADNTWCSKCNYFVSEEICRYYFEQLFNKPFPKTKLNCLKSDKGNNLELDGYCGELRIAFEHQGRQHYINNSKFKNLQQIQRNDQLKKEQCDIYDIKLILIPELFSLTKIKDLKTLIINECKKINVLIDNVDINLNYQEILINKSDVYLEKANKIIKSFGGKLLSDKYINSYSKLLIKCDSDHVFEKSLNDLNKNSWCRQCFLNSKKLNIDEIKQRYSELILVSDIYEYSNLELDWICKKCLYEFSASIFNLRYSKIKCPNCRKGK